MEAEILLNQLFYESGSFLVMFFVAGVVLNLFTELIKKQIFPKYSEEETSEGKFSKSCPSWIGMLIGVANTIVFTILTVTAHLNGAEHCAIIGGLTWVFIWVVGFYVYQMSASLLVKLILRKMFPFFMTGKPRNKKPPKAERATYLVPKGSKVEYVDEEELNG